MRVRSVVQKACAAIAAGALVIGLAAPALAAPACWSAELVRAARMRQLDVMLMVGSLRCRGTAQDYRAAYDRFLLRHRPQLGRVNQMILAEMRGRLGPIGALEALDEASVRMANRYGERADYGCADLGQIAAALAESGDEALPRAGDLLVGEDVALERCPVQVAVAAIPPARKLP